MKFNIFFHKIPVQRSHLRGKMVSGPTAATSFDTQHEDMIVRKLAPISSLLGIELLGLNQVYALE